MSKKPPKRPSTTSSDTASKTVWLWAAAIAAWNIGVNPENQHKETKWEGYGEDLEVARLLLHVLRDGPEVFDRLADEMTREDEDGTLAAEPELPKPAGFVSWARTATELFAEIGLNDDPSELQLGQVVRWSPYHLELVRDPKDPAYDERIEKPVKPEMVAGLIEYARMGEHAANYDLVKVVVRKKRLVVADGRQRSRGHVLANEQLLSTWYQDLMHSFDLAPAMSDHARLRAPPALLLRGVECIVRPLSELVLLKTISNSAGSRTNETLLQEARCAWELEDLGKSSTEIAALRGHTTQTVRNYLVLRKLTPDWLGALRDGSVTIKSGYRLAREPVKRQDAGWKHVDKIEKAELAAEKKKWNGRLPHGFEAEQLARREKLVTRWLDGAGDEPSAVVPPVVPAAQRARTHDRLAGFHAHLQHLPTSPIVESFRQLAAALLGDKEAAKKLPAQLRAGLTGAWLPFPKETRDGWNNVGIWEPATLDALRQYYGEERRGPDGAHRTLTPELAGTAWADGLTLGGAVELGKLTPAAFWRALRQEQLPLAGDPLQLGEAPVEHKEAKPKRSRRGKEPELWGGRSREAWETAGIWDERLAMQVHSLGVTPEQMQLVMPADADAALAGQSFATLLTMGRLSLVELQAALRDGIGEEADESPAIDRNDVELADDAYSVECPSCEAVEGQPCAGEAGVVAPHLTRKLKAEKLQHRAQGAQA